MDALEDAKAYVLLQARNGIRRMVLEVRIVTSFISKTKYYKNSKI
jgi:hypothetical protein